LGAGPFGSGFAGVGGDRWQQAAGFGHGAELGVGDPDAEVPDGDAAGCCLVDPPFPVVADTGQEFDRFAFGEFGHGPGLCAVAVPHGDGGVPDRQAVVEAHSTVDGEDGADEHPGGVAAFAA
jgi:hypothetical protein